MRDQPQFVQVFVRMWMGPAAAALLVTLGQSPVRASDSNWVVAAPLKDRSSENRKVIRRAKYPVIYICSVDDTTDALGHLSVTRTLGFDGKHPRSFASWNGGAYDNKMPVAGALNLGANWGSNKNGDLNLAGGAFKASWEMFPPAGTAQNPPEAFFVGGRGTRLPLASTWPLKYNKPRMVTVWVNWGEIFAAAKQPGDLVFTVQARGASPARRMSIDALLPKIAAALARMDGFVRAGAKNFRSRCEATEQVPIN